MNLLEHHILEVIEEKDVSNAFEMHVGHKPSEPLLSIKMKINCYGVEEVVTKTMFKSEYEKALKDGFYLA